MRKYHDGNISFLDRLLLSSRLPAILVSKLLCLLTDCLPQLPAHPRLSGEGIGNTDNADTNGICNGL